MRGHALDHEQRVAYPKRTNAAQKYSAAFRSSSNSARGVVLNPTGEVYRVQGNVIAPE
jgi:hypothetical protein